MSKIKETENILDLLQIRSEESYTQIDQSQCQSISSDESPAQQISQTIQNMIQQEKKKYAPSKSDNQMMKNSEIVRMKKLYSASTIFALKPTFQLPLNISRIFHTTKRYPNVPLLQKNQRILDTIYGAFFGFLIGDVTGAYLAFNTQRLDLFLPQALLMNGGGTYNLGAGQGTDQTQLLFSATYGLIEGKGVYNQNLMAKKYLEWLESKPFNFSPIIALALRDLRKMKESGDLDEKKIGKVLRQSSMKNLKIESNVGLVRILPLTVFSLKFQQSDFQKIIKDQLNLISPNPLVFQTGIVYAKILRVIILTGDHERAFYEASKWVYEEGTEKLKDLWYLVEHSIEIQSRGNMGNLKTAFSFSCIEINKKQINFFDTLIHNLQRGGDTDANCAIVMAMIGAIVGYNGIPGYFKQKIINSRMRDSPRPRDEIYSPHQIIDIIEKLVKVQPNRLFSIS